MTEYIIGLTGSMASIGICKGVCNTASHLKLIDFLSNIEKYTLGIYVVQIFVLEGMAVAIPFFHISEIGFFEDYILLLIVGIIFTFISYYIVRITLSIQWVGNLFYGRQYHH
ncbi:MAG: hypothetical protein ACOYJK_10010 [Prevotella sp.]|jgi:hypothetical protein